MGQKLTLAPLSADLLLTRLCNVKYYLSKVDQEPSKSMQNALSGLMKALVAKHPCIDLNEDVEVAAASCICDCEVTRVTAPSTPYDDDQMRASVSVEYSEDAVGLKVEVCWPKDQIGQMSASPDKVRSAEPSSLHTSGVHRSGQPKKRKSAASRASAHEKRMCHNAGEAQNTLDDTSLAFKFKTTQRESLNETMLYQKCLEELQNLEGLDDAEFGKTVNVLKDDKNAIAFTTIKGPRRLVWFRSLWQPL